MTPLNFKIIQQLNSTFFKVQNDNEYGVIDNFGNIRIPMEKRDVAIYSDDIFINETSCRTHDQYGDLGKFEITYVLVDVNNKQLTPHDDYSVIEPFDLTVGLAKVERHKRIGFINNEFQETIPCKYIDTSCYFPEQVTEFKEGVCCLKYAANEFHYLDSKGRTILKAHYFLALNFSEGFAAVEKRLGGWGFIDEDGNEIIECQYDDAYSFSNGLAAVKDKRGHYNSRQWGFIDKENKLVIPFSFDDVKPFRNGFSIARKGSKYGVIDILGKEAIPFIHSHIDGNETEPSWPYSYVRIDDTRFITGKFNVYLTDTRIPHRY
ncbi:MAG: WG repeat-containing protein [Sphingobacteriales bacterium]|nr:WG repeat-containing protein [Sphingobacteriales bacterium]OJV98428.1 MAG: hypothetical protein BGO52_11610 [Sphingobacteriales bacterium 44-61]